ncbi:unnamed protein product [Prorocentrum cordatum]|uniref:Uncharacterized protein n=1 Tax=Prorocentrum cordatum TaxID=2364126 RepID=A0ABN9U0S6_9DINO|nr:unnamed protein product [Polarella glacialis]
MSAATDSGLVAQVWQAWLVVTDEEKKARQLEEQMKSSDVRLKQMLANTKGKAFGVASRTNEQINENLLLRVLSAWMIEFKVGHVEKYYEKKINGKRQQLTKVHTLFKDFANQLENGLKPNDGDSSGRTGTTRDRRTKGSLVKEGRQRHRVLAGHPPEGARLCLKASREYRAEGRAATTRPSGHLRPWGGALKEPAGRRRRPSLTASGRAPSWQALLL